MAERTSTFQTDTEPDRDDRITRSRRELYRERLDLFVLTPLRVIWSDWRTRVGSLIILAWVFLGTVGYWLVSEPFPGDGPRMDPPSRASSSRWGRRFAARVSSHSSCRRRPRC